MNYNEIIFLNLEIFFWKSTPTRHIKYNVINLLLNIWASFNPLGTISKMDQFYALIARNISRVNFSKLAKMATFKPP